MVVNVVQLDEPNRLTGAIEPGGKVVELCDLQRREAAQGARPGVFLRSFRLLPFGFP
jgi:hypothetical protein